jgi:hypothetical protein
MSRIQLLGYIRRGALCAICLSMIAACTPPTETGDKAPASKKAALLGRLKAMDGQSGEFEGVYRPGLREGSSFEFCTKTECPDDREIDCEPVFNEEARSVLRPFWGKNEGAAIHMFALGTLHTLGKDGKASEYGHLGEHLCKIAISQVYHPRIVETLVVRSKRYPDLTKPLK